MRLFAAVLVGATLGISGISNAEMPPAKPAGSISASERARFLIEYEMISARFLARLLGYSIEPNKTHHIFAFYRTFLGHHLTEAVITVESYFTAADSFKSIT